MKDNKGIVQIHGKDYMTVARRLELWHEDNKGISSEIGIDTEVLSHDPVVIKATIYWGKKKYAGISSVAKNSFKQIEKQNPYEVAETSAVGRALGFAGYGIIEGIASADEMHKSAYQEAQEHLEAYKQPVDEDPSVVTPEQEAQQEADEFYTSHPEMKEKPATNSFCKVHGVEMERKFSQAKNKWYSIHRDNDQACFGFGYK